LGSRWAGLALRAHVKKAIDYSKPPVVGWDVQEYFVFDAIEQELIAELHRLIFEQHMTIASISYEDAFTMAMEHAKTAYTQYGRARLPWLKWTPDKTIADKWVEHCKWRNDPANKAMLQQLQNELNEKSRKLAAAVELELQIMKQAAEHARQQELAAKNRRHHGFIPGRVHKRR
jgi:polyhydroxyalkanoate synthesis regulator phasin